MKKRTRKQKKKKPKKKKRIFYILLVIILLVIVILAVKLIKSSLFLEKREILATLIVGNKMGFDVNGTAFTYGMVTRGGSSTRSVLIENYYDFPIKVEVIPRGDVVNFIKKRSLIFEKGEVREVGVSAYVPRDTEFGNYTGSIEFIFKKYIWKFR